MCYLGPEVDHIKQSRGGDSDVLKHYATSYATAYSAYWENFTPSPISLSGSGYVSNTRPSLGYTDKLDDIDNPPLKNILKGNYLSTTHKDYTPFVTPCGKEPLPSLTREPRSRRDKSNFVLTGTDFFDQKSKDILTPVTPKTKPLLLSRKGLWDIEDENFGYGPSSHSTTYSEHFGQARPLSYDLSRTNIGHKEESGPTRNTSSFDNINNRFGSSYIQGQPRWKTDRPIGQTVYMDDFKPYSYKNGSEGFPRWIGNLSHQKPNSYVIQNKLWPEFKNIDTSKVYDHAENMPEERLEMLRKEDPAEYQNVIHGFIEPSMSKGVHNGVQVQPKSVAEQLGRMTVGPVQPSGATLNLTGSVQTRDTPPDRFVTHNMTRYYHPPPGQNANDREGHIHFNTQPSKETETSRSARLSCFEAQLPSTDKLGTFDPYQSRSIQARDSMPIPPTKNTI
ncbi:unnamed protein product [Trichobilharzia szidati]|nr:unnamed protein product [Trichobilharzia szidati]